MLMVTPGSLCSNKAFSKQASHFDEDDSKNPILQWMRKQVRCQVLNFLPENSSILELNAGTGLDAIFFINIGHTVTATDLSDGMIQQLYQKKGLCHSPEKLVVKQLSYDKLEPLYGNNYDHIFSNFGGLNCIDDLRKVTVHFKHLLKPGGFVTFVIMQPICPWELITLLKGKFNYAFRRLKGKKTKAHLEGYYFDTWYFTPKKVIKSFGKNYKKIELRGLATLTPPPERMTFAIRNPTLIRMLNKLDEKLCSKFPFNRWGDHFILTMQYLGEKEPIS